MSKTVKSKIALQMYTVRDHTKTERELADTLQKAAKVGYRAVQLSAIGCMNGPEPEVDAKRARQLLDNAGLSCIATHRPWDALQQEIEREIEFHHALGCDFAAIGGIPKPQYGTTYDGYRTWLKDAAPVIEKLKAAGIRFGHHNHSHEFFRPERYGKTLEDILIDEGPQDLMLELDLYWIAHSGTNPERVLERCHNRVPVIHLKDREVLEGTNTTEIAPIGEGTLDWAHIIPSCERAGVEWYTVEQDTCRRDPFDCIRSSYDYLANLELPES